MSDFLQSGTYSFNKNHTQLINCNNFNEIYDISQTNINKSKVKIIISNIDRIIFKKKYKIFNQKGYFYGTRLLIPNNDTGFKVFDENYVLTFYNDVNYQNRIITNRDKISSIFYVPKVLHNVQNYTIEEKILCKEFNTENFIHYMCERYAEFFQLSQIRITQDSSDYKRKYKRLFKHYYQHFHGISKKQTVFQHGDIWDGNIIFNDKYYLIDFEICHDRFYLYDFFFYIYSYTFIYDNYDYLDNYFDGKYDNILIEYCDSLETTYDVNLKGFYFKEFILNFMEDRFKDYSIRIFYKESKKILALFNKYNIG